MRNLYRRLGIFPRSPVEQIRRAIGDQRDPDVAEAARLVLLNEEIRKSYDQAHMTLTDIAVLRSDLGLDAPDNLSASLGSEFTVPPAFNQEEPFSPWSGEPRSATHTPTGNGATGHHSDVFLFRWIGRHPWLTCCLVILIPLAMSGFRRGLLPQQSGVDVTGVDSPADQTKEAHVAKLPPGTIGPDTNAVPDRPLPPRPPSGLFEMLANEKGLAPLTIKTTPGEDYLVKLVSLPANQTAMTVYVRGGDTVSVDVPLGTYELRYASGTLWQGEPLWFGNETSYFRASTALTFLLEAGQYLGHSITLYKVRNGNLKTSPIRSNQF